MRRTHGFTLIELLVAIAVMALLAIMSWRGLDSMVRTQSQTREHADAVLTVQAAFAQWNADLDAITELPQTQALDWNGQALRMTRRSGDRTSAAVFIVAWTFNGTYWRRWQSTPVTTLGDWQQAWAAALAWAQSGNVSSTGGTETTLMSLNSWQLLYFRNGGWGPATPAGAVAPPSSSPATPGAPTSSLPDGIRLVLDLPPGPGLHGAITRDWVRPTSAIPKSS